jgi:sulfur carrier protein
MTSSQTITQRVTLNGEPVLSQAETLAALLDERGYAGVKIATAVNGTFVPARARGDVTLSDGDHIEVVAARQGG